MKAVRWGDNDRYLGPFTWCPNDYIRYGIVLESSGEESKSYLRLHFWKLTLCIATPNWLLKPQMEKVYPGWDYATVERLGRDWYWNITRRAIGFCLSGSGRMGGGCDFLQVYRGVHTMDSSTDRSWAYFLPWKSWRHVRHSYYGLKGEWLADAPHNWHLSGLNGRPTYQDHQKVEESIPVRRYRFKDFDGEELTVSVRLEEREWRRGEGWWKWLSWFWPPLIARSACFTFSGETGKRKGSWKGGTTGSSIELKYRGDLHLDGFVKYCNENQMKFTGIVVDDEPPTSPEAA